MNLLLLTLISLRRSGLNNPPVEVKVVAPITVEEKTVTYSDPIVPTTYVEKPPLFVRVILGLIHLLSKSKLNLVLLWLKISWMII